MRQMAIVTLACVAASAATAAPTLDGAESTVMTGKSVEQFAGCFVAAQDRAGSAWSFIPKGDGGTFSNAGAKSARSVYFLAVSDRGSAREIRLEAATDPRLARTIDRCI